jgi:hypothetical protein
VRSFYSRWVGSRRSCLVLSVLYLANNANNLVLRILLALFRFIHRMNFS